MVLLVRLYLNCGGADAGQVVVKLWWCSGGAGRGLYNGKGKEKGRRGKE
jgi:hypothetical protein